MGGSLRPLRLQSFNTEATEMLRALRVESLMLAEYTELLPGDGMLIHTEGEESQHPAKSLAFSSKDDNPPRIFPTVRIL